MRCPVCRCETGNQSVCPYCGTTVYTGNTTYTMTDYARHTQPTQHTTQPQSRERGRSYDKKLRRIETKLDLLMVLQIGIFLLLLIVTVMTALK